MRVTSASLPIRTRSAGMWAIIMPGCGAEVSRPRFSFGSRAFFGLGPCFFGAAAAFFGDAADMSATGIPCCSATVNPSFRILKVTNCSRAESAKPDEDDDDDAGTDEIAKAVALARGVFPITTCNLL